MTIGVFDSGVGGLSVHRALVEAMPQADFIYLADQANAPYGGKPGEEIVELTKAGCIRLFDEGADLVLLACNTAAAIALRRLQQTWLPQLSRQPRATRQCDWPDRADHRGRHGAGLGLRARTARRKGAGGGRDRRFLHPRYHQAPGL